MKKIILLIALITLVALFLERWHSKDDPGSYEASTRTSSDPTQPPHQPLSKGSTSKKEKFSGVIEKIEKWEGHTVKGEKG